ncbi:hypothetical protein CPB83DRAFT_834783 [Crepidotus variabilis]|uniref:Uncharacterized protein n=1 Tax=Crepidotus variabilis TaxID=179855 RepID=A0A9P6EJC0_9AGAR|nr:hypothetical protein CPB83DRAFT_834783 [Crepidotus variabilis]
MTLEWSLLTGKIKFKWPLIFYFANRYCYLMAAMLGSPINCNYLFTAGLVLGYMAQAFSGVNLAIRLIAVWSQNLVLRGFLCAMIIGYWVIVISEGSRVSAIYDPDEGCHMKYDNYQAAARIQTYSLCFDSVILILSLYKLRTGITQMPRGSLTSIIVQQGVIFFGTATPDAIVTRLLRVELFARFTSDFRILHDKLSMIKAHSRLLGAI